MSAAEMDTIWLGEMSMRVTVSVGTMFTSPAMRACTSWFWMVPSSDRVRLAWATDSLASRLASIHRISSPARPSLTTRYGVSMKP